MEIICLASFFMSLQLIDTNLNIVRNIVNKTVLRVTTPMTVSVCENFMSLSVTEFWESWLLLWEGQQMFSSPGVVFRFLPALNTHINQRLQTPDYYKTILSVKHAWHSSMVYSQVVDRGDNLQIWRVAANTMSKQWWTANKRWLSSLGVGHGANDSWL